MKAPELLEAVIIKYSHSFCMLKEQINIPVGRTGRDMIPSTVNPFKEMEDKIPRLFLN